MSENKFSYSKVLLVDDSDIDVLVNRRLMELTRFASHVRVFTNAEDALDFLRKECRNQDDAPDWIFLDMYLPMMSGYDFVEEFKKLPGFITDKTRITILSVFQKQERLLKLFENPFVVNQFEKPLTQEGLKELAKQFPEKVNVSS